LPVSGEVTTVRLVLALGARRLTHTAGVVCLVGLAVGNTKGQDKPASPLTGAAISTEIGNTVDAQGVISTVLTRLFPPTGALSPTKVFFLGSQVRDEWLPVVKGIEFVRLSEPDAVALVANCGTYWMVGRVHRANDVVSLVFSRKCGAGSRHYRVRITGLEYQADLVGVGSGLVASPDCPCSGR
jgi:hypothetical protein